MNDILMRIKREMDAMRGRLFAHETWAYVGDTKLTSAHRYHARRMSIRLETLDIKEAYAISDALAIKLNKYEGIITEYPGLLAACIANGRSVGVFDGINALHIWRYVSIRTDTEDEDDNQR